MHTLTERDLARLEHVHPDLIAVVKRAAEHATAPFIVVEGLRSLSRQRQLVAEGKSKTMNSRHLAAKNGFGHAVDLVIVVNGRAEWARGGDVAAWMKRASRDLGIPVEWGGDWAGAWDKPHFQLPWKSYPGRSVASLDAGSRSVQGLTAAATGQGLQQGAGGAGESVQAAIDALLPASEAVPVIGTVVAWLQVAGLVLTVGGILWAAYARWDDAGRPLPGFLRFGGRE